MNQLRRSSSLAAHARWAALTSDHARLQARFDLLREATSDGLWDVELGERKLTDPANEFIWSDQVRRLVGYRDETDLPNGLRSWMELLHPDDMAGAVAAFTAHILDRTGQTPYDVIYRMRHKNGEYRWFRALSYAQRNASGRAIRVAGALTDITDRRAMLDLKRYAEAIIASLPTGLMILSDTLAVVSMNRAFCDILKLADEDAARGLDMGAIALQAGLREEAAAVLAAGGTRHGIGVALGEKRLRMAMAGIELAEGERRLLVMAEDVTEEQRLREEARSHAARYRDQASLLDKARDAIIVRGIDGRVQFWNKGAQRLYGWTSEEVLGKQIDHWLYHDGPAASCAVVQTTLCEGEWSGEVAQRRKDGSLLMVEGYWTLVRDEEELPKSFLVINTDITQRKASDEKIRNLALYDTLTGLANRTLFTERLGAALERARISQQPLAVLFMDLNRFKEINDTQGHGVGDQVLVRVARRFQAALREEEVLARLAGDEFVVVAERADARTAAIIGERLGAALADPVATHGQTFSVGLSIGIATWPRDGADIEDLLKRADIAMYRAKAAGGGYMFYQPEMSVGLLESMELAKDLGRALAEGALELHYQPQVNLASGAPIGAEALLRWRDPRRGWVSPATFIPIAENRRMIGALGKWVLGEACRQLRAWFDAGMRFPGRLWINLSAQQLDDPDTVVHIRTMTAEAGVPPSSLGLELTESGLMADVEGAIRTMATLRADGFAIAIDDFGTGYSSLAYLKRLPADKLKIDMSFVRDMLRDHHDHTIVTTIIGMARNLGLEVIAEGVEEHAQSQALRTLGCDQAQGYHFGRPEPAEVFASRWLVVEDAAA
ncbi:MULTISPECIES: EAL domain-containing protein [unclassified Massilia]|uniref:bifunctional diguanylate cyclase/phosphodiesterase n=1 Tax=unclassified Massilia TaxID=2609279 RepID=UPI00177D6117|nr:MULTISPECIES: EAL domain-containing protein [unclassified Massilia]MBD8532168.1 EAL domain-containing protein [Massilia sp. CFBP 13647]MBD8675574.1 EAL domain-containing protein [Massilia sp. CFBP 13721]